MRQFVTIATNAFMELVRQPVFLLLMTCSAVFEIFLATPYYFAFGDEPKLVKNSTLAAMLLAGLLGAVLSASASLAREIRSGTAPAVLILFALWILAGLALACSTRLDIIPTLAICSGLFLLGIMSDYLFGRPAEHGSWWGSVLYSVTPNWQLFWIADTLDTGKSTFHWNYVAKAFAYVVAYVGAALAFAVALFEDRELS